MLGRAVRFIVNRPPTRGGWCIIGASILAVILSLLVKGGA